MYVGVGGGEGGGREGGGGGGGQELKCFAHKGSGGEDSTLLLLPVSRHPHPLPPSPLYLISICAR